MGKKKVEIFHRGNVKNKIDDRPRLFGSKGVVQRFEAKHDTGGPPRLAFPRSESF